MKSKTERGHWRATKALWRLCASVMFFGVVSPAYSQFSGFVYSNGSYAQISDPAGTNTMAFGINNLGQVVGGYNTAPAGISNYQYGFLYSNGTYTTLSVPGATQTVAFGINDAGQIVGHYDAAADGQGYGFLYSNGMYTTLSVPEKRGWYRELRFPVRRC